MASSTPHSSSPSRSPSNRSPNGRVADQGLAEGLSEVASNLKGAIDRSLKDQPTATLAVASFVGFILGALWRA